MRLRTNRPLHFAQISTKTIIGNLIKTLFQGCHQIGRAFSLPPTAVLSGLIALTSHVITPATVAVPGINWEEPVLVWLSIKMPTGTGYDLTLMVRKRSGCSEDVATWFVGDATFEKMDELMSKNNGCLFGLYDELSTFLTQLNLYHGKGLAVSHELGLFLQLYNGSSWSRQTGT